VAVLFISSLGVGAAQAARHRHHNAVWVSAQPPDFCIRHPKHPHCQTPTPTPTEPTPTPTPTEPPGQCAVSTPNVPDGPDGMGGCFPGPASTGPDEPASAMPAYTGPCTITTPNTVIDSMVVNCTLEVYAGGFVLSNSYLYGTVSQHNGASYTVADVFMDAGKQFPACWDNSCPAGKYACTDCSLDGTDFSVLRTEVINTNRAVWCNSCLVEDSYFHGTNLWPDISNLSHASAMREEQNGTIRHNSLWCSYTGPFINDEIGCSADLTGYPDFAPINHNTVDGNLFVAAIGAAYCAYGGGTGTKPYSNDPTNATYQVFTDNVFQRGTNGKCAFYGPITDFITGRTGNVWSGNVWDDGTVVNPG
jgi:hypothetical protein